MRAFQNILVPTDFSACSRIALERALTLAKAFGSHIDVIYADAPVSYAPDVEAPEDTNARLESFLREVALGDIPVSRRVETGNPAEVIQRASQNYDLIVMGTSGKSGVRRLLLGSVAEQVIREASCPVMTVRENTRRPVGERIIYALFDDPQSFTKARDALREIGIADVDVSVFISEERRSRDFDILERTQAPLGVAAGGLLAGTVGGIVGGLLSLGAATGLVGLLVMGPAVAFAAAGGVAGGLIGWGVPEELAKRLQEAVQNGKVLMAVHVRDDKLYERADKVLFAFDGETVEVTG